MNNYKVAPFRKWSKGYTGQQKVALRQNMKFSLDDLNLVSLPCYTHSSFFLGETKGAKVDRLRA